MNPTDEQVVREQLERAVAPLDPAAPPLEMLRASAVRRRRFRLAFGAGVTAAAAAIVGVVLVVVPGGGTKQRVTVDRAPSADSLAAFAAGQHGKHVAGPIESSTGYYGAFAVKKGVRVVRYVEGAWQPDGAVITDYGPGRWIMSLAGAGTVIPGVPSFAMRYRGGDVSYFGGVVALGDGVWRAAEFATCSNRELSCWNPGTEQPYGHVVNGRFVSIHNDCTPYCAAGTDYRVTWKWYRAAGRFTAFSERVIRD